MTTLTSKERVLRALRREPTDVVAAMPYMYDIAAIQTDVPLLDYYTDPEAMVKAQLGLYELVGQDVLAIGADNYYIAEGFGCVTTRSNEELPSLEKPPLSNINEVFDLEVPDPYTDGRMPVMLEAIKLAKKAVGDEVIVRSPGTGPFALASYLIGTQEWLMEIAMIQAGMPEANEKAVRHALDLTTEALTRFGIACWEAGADMLHNGDSLASCNVISPDTYRNFAYPSQVKVFDAWAEHGIDRKLLHICGDSTPVLDDYAATGADMIEIDEAVKMAVAKERIGDRSILIGNIHTVIEFLQGTPESISAASLKAIDDAGYGGGFLLGSGCIVPRYSPLENVQAMVNAAHSQQYPGMESL